MKGLKHILIISLSLLLGACGTTKKISETTNTTNTTLEHFVTYKDTVFTVPKAKSQLKIPLIELINKPQSKPFKIQQKNGRSSATAQVVKDTLFVTSDCDSIAIAAKIKQELIKQNTVNSSQTKTEIKTETGYSLFKVIGYVFIAFALGFIAGYFIKFLKNIKSKLL